MRTTTALGEPPKSCLKMEMELDRISNLPSEITDQILSGLTIKEAARTSCLSTKWRIKWAMLPNLVFDNVFLGEEDVFPLPRTHKAARVIDHILLTHIGPIQKFELSGDSVQDRDIDSWILHLSRHSTIREFILKSNYTRLYKMPSCFFYWSDLIQLDLYRCSLKPPSTFKGFRSLKILRLDHVIMDQDVFQKMNFPLLEKLEMVSCPNQLKIDASNLQCLHLVGYFGDVSIVNTFNLIDVDISIVPAAGSPCSTRLLNFFRHMPHVQRLNIQLDKYFAYGVVPEKLPDPHLELKFLTIALCFHDLEKVNAALCLLRSSPSLEKLEIKALNCQDHRADGAAISWSADKHSNSFTKLRHVLITSICGFEAELNLIRFLLSSSPVLETMTVTPGYNHPHTKLLDLVKKLLRFRRASAKAEIIYS